MPTVPAADQHAGGRAAIEASILGQGCILLTGSSEAHRLGAGGLFLLAAPTSAAVGCEAGVLSDAFSFPKAASCVVLPCLLPFLIGGSPLWYCEAVLGNGCPGRCEGKLLARKLRRSA